MIIFLYGPDTYRSRQKLNEIIEYYKKIHKSGLNLRCFDVENLNFQDFKSEIETVSMFREKKLVVLKDVFSNKDFQEKFLKQGKRFTDSGNAILIYEKKEIDKKNSLFKFFKKNSKSQEFIPLKGQKLKNWVKKEFARYQAEIDPKGTIDELINFVGSNLWQMECEIKKLVNYKNGQKIKREDIELLVRPKIETDIFKTIRALAFRNKKQALILIHKHLEKGDHPLYLLAMINYQFRQLITRKRNNLFTAQELKKIYQKIFQADLAIKTGKVEPETGLDLLITEI